MRKIFFVGAFAAVAGFALTAQAGPSAEDQTSSQQVQACASLTTQCEGGDFDSCRDALKNCTQPDRKKIMDILASS